jgi:hypothetical protein
MRRPALTIGILTAELVVGALAAAPSAAADDVTPAPIPDTVTAGTTASDTGPSDTPPTSDPEPAPIDPLGIIRTGRAIDLPTLPEIPVELPRLPLALGGDADATPSSVPEPSAPAPDAPTPASPAPTTGSSKPSDASPVPDPALPTGSAQVPAASAPPAHSVVAGDSLWGIAATQLAIVSGRDRSTLSAADIAGYWVRVCEANRGRLQSGDLNLIYAGEVVELPAV